MQKEIVPRVGDTKEYTTHLVAAKLGTQKVRTATKSKGTPTFLGTKIIGSYTLYMSKLVLPKFCRK